jgi:hypothetical protein
VVWPASGRRGRREGGEKEDTMQTVQERPAVESLKVEGGQLFDKVKELIHEGNVRRIVVRQGEHTIVELPLTIGVIGAASAPTLAAIGAIAALITDCTIEIERVETGETTDTPPATP